MTAKSTRTRRIYNHNSSPDYCVPSLLQRYPCVFIALVVLVPSHPCRALETRLLAVLTEFTVATWHCGYTSPAPRSIAPVPVAILVNAIPHVLQLIQS